MKNTGEYTGTPDDVLNRYDYLSGLQDTTGYSQREWKIIYAHSGVVMDVLLARHRGELPKYWQLTPEQIQHKKEVVESYRGIMRAKRLEKKQETEMMKIRKNINISVLLVLLQEIVEKKELLENQRREVSVMVSESAGSATKLKAFYDAGDNDYSSQETDQLILWIVYYTGLIKSGKLDKAHKVLCRGIVKDLYIELDTRGCPMDFVEVNRTFITMPHEKKNAFCENLNNVSTKVVRSKNGSRA